MKHSALKASLVIILVIGLFPTTFSFAQDITIADLQKTINQLKEQITLLQAQIEQLKTGLSSVRSELAEARTELQFTKTLHRGIRGDEVRVLQEFLKGSPEIYPEGLVTGYFGPITEAAVQNFQKTHGIVSSGIPDTTGYGQVGPKTRAKLNELITVGAGASGVIPPGLLIAPGVQERIATTTPEEATTTPSVVATTPLTATTTPSLATTTPIMATTTPTEATTTPTEALAPIETGGGGAAPAPTITTTETTADTTPPVISNLQTTNITETSATITWTTDETSDSKVDYALISSFTTATTTIDSTNVTSHNINLSSLGSNTIHYYIAVSADEDGNIATSSEQTFTTLSPPAQQCEGIVC